MLRRERDPEETASVLEKYDSLNTLLDGPPSDEKEKHLEEEDSREEGETDIQKIELEESGIGVENKDEISEEMIRTSPAPSPPPSPPPQTEPRGDTPIDGPIDDEVRFPESVEVPPENKIPHNQVFPERKIVDPMVPRTTVNSSRTESSTGMFSNPYVLYGTLAAACLAVIFLFMRRSSEKPGQGPSSGPVIVDVTETAGKEAERSVKNSVNRVSSPRIIFGDLRKNPSLMVAPPMTPAHTN